MDDYEYDKYMEKFREQRIAEEQALREQAGWVEWKEEIHGNRKPQRNIVRLRAEVSRALQACKSALPALDWEVVTVGQEWKVISIFASLRETAIIHCALEDSLRADGWLIAYTSSTATCWIPNPEVLPEELADVSLSLLHCTGEDLIITFTDTKAKEESVSPPSAPARVIRRLTGDSNDR